MMGKAQSKGFCRASRRAGRIPRWKFIRHEVCCATIIANTSGAPSGGVYSILYQLGPAQDECFLDIFKGVLPAYEDLIQPAEMLDWRGGSLTSCGRLCVAIGRGRVRISPSRST